MSELDLKRKMVEHYRGLASRAQTVEQREYYDREFEKAARAYNKALMKGRR